MLSVGLLYSKIEIGNNNDGDVDIDRTNVTVKAIKKALINNGHKVTLIPASIDLLQKISEVKDLDVIFNACTGITNKIQQANVVAMLELQNIPFVGSGLSTHILGLHKQISKRLFSSVNIPTPNFQVFYTSEDELDCSLKFPLIIKPEHEGSSVGITEDSVVFNEESLRAGIINIINVYKQPALVEEFISGREFTIGVLGNDEPVVLPILEIIFDDNNVSGLKTLCIKSNDTLATVCPAIIDKETTELISFYAKKAYLVLGCNEYARIDVRMDANNIPYFIEINTLPGLQPNYSSFIRVAKVGGYEYDDLIDKMVNLTIERYKATLED